MDLIKQRQLYGWVIGILVALNLLALTVVWIQSGRDAPPPAGKDAQNPAAISTALMQRELGFSAAQEKAYEQLRAAEQDEIKRVNDELDALRLRLVDVIFDANLNHRQIDSTVAQISVLQSRLEMLRLNHFRKLVQLCDREQQDKLRPILREVYSRRGASGDRPPRLEGGQPVEPGAAQGPPRAGSERAEEHQPPPGPDDRQGPPTLEEKLDRYTRGLSLTAEQRSAVEKIFKSTKAKEDSFRDRMNPTEEQFEAEKVKLRAQEDAGVMSLLNAEQKSQFERMVKNRPPPREGGIRR